jgi:CheY-like chemotaxis protein/DNA-binding XRE family transcriptional regulator
MEQLRLVVADDNPQSLKTLVSLLQAEFEIVATATDGKSTLELVRQWKPDVVVLDLNLPAGNGIEVTQELARDPQGPAVVICLEGTNSAIVDAALRAGATAYVSKSQIGEGLVLAVQSARRGLSFAAGKGKRGGAAGRAKFFKDLGRRVQELRVKAGYTQASMAKFGFSVRHWQQIEAGRPTTLTTMLRICELFKIKLEDLLHGLD